LNPKKLSSFRRHLGGTEEGALLLGGLPESFHLGIIMICFAAINMACDHDRREKTAKCLVLKTLKARA
jgi:hypothetical protein